jgi:dipeptidyl aminopeptidase/acylaminoacyl peptidase
MQLFTLSADGTDSRVITTLDRPVGRALFVGEGSKAVVEIDQGGDECHQLYLVDTVGGPYADVSEMVALTDGPRYGHHLCGVSPDGGRVAYLSNRANGIDFDLWICDLANLEHRMVLATGAYCQPGSGFSPDGSWVTILRPGPLPLDSDLVLVNVHTAEQRVVLPHSGEAAQSEAPVWSGNESLILSSNVGSDKFRVGMVGLDDLSTFDVLVENESFDIDLADVSSDGRYVVVLENHDGVDVMVVVDRENSGDTARSMVPLEEPGVVSLWTFPKPHFMAGTSRLFFTMTNVRQPPTPWVFEVGKTNAERLKSLPSELETLGLGRAEAASVRSFDGEEIPFFYLRPLSSERGKNGRSPVVMIIHGGPEGQSQQSFNPIMQALAASGYMVLVPNVRGSTGYGKRYAALDDTTKRLDSVKDLRALHSWIGDNGFDSERVTLWGGSYGGYMVLAGLAFQPELWAAGVDIVGISDLVTFLENTSDYRRSHREKEYGSLKNDRSFLEAASPMRSVEAMRAPLFVIHGQNDPRVPVGETIQMTKALKERGIPCELVVYDDEGHGLARLKNKLDAYPKAFSFLERYVQ